MFVSLSEEIAQSQTVSTHLMATSENFAFLCLLQKSVMSGNYYLFTFKLKQLALKMKHLLAVIGADMPKEIIIGPYSYGALIHCVWTEHAFFSHDFCVKRVMVK